MEITPKGDGLTASQVVESAEIANAPKSLRGHQAIRQLVDPIRIASQSREVGFAAFSIDGILQPEAIDEYWTNVARLNLIIYDAVKNVQVAEYEVWPSFWLDVAERTPEMDPRTQES